MTHHRTLHIAPYLTVMILRILLLLSIPSVEAFASLSAPSRLYQSSYIHTRLSLPRLASSRHSHSTTNGHVVNCNEVLLTEAKNIVSSSDEEQPVAKQVPLPIRRRTVRNKRKMEVAWCTHDKCTDAIREKVVGSHNHMELTGPATGQVVYSWEKYSIESGSSAASSAEQTTANNNGSVASPPAVLILVKREEEKLTKVAVDVISKLMNMGVQVLVDTILAGNLSEYVSVDMESDMIRLFEPKPVAGFGTDSQLKESTRDTKNNPSEEIDDDSDEQPSADLSDPDLIVTLGGDGLLMYAAHVFSGPVPPILPVAGGSMGFLTPFAREEMFDAILISLGIQQVDDEELDESEDDDNMGGLRISQRANNNMQVEATSPDGYTEQPALAFGRNNQICISMRMRLDCRIFGSDGTLKSRYNVLNEVVIDRGSSPYLASLECFCDDVHLTTVQADGIIFSTPTGSTAYSMAAGGSVVHPAVPAILVTPICPHVLSFRSMVFPDHVVLRCYVPSDARSTACVYFDGKHRTELNRGDSVQIEMSAHPVPTINRADHSSDWLSSLKRNFNFNTRVRQNPLR